jgi:mxaJ protein
MTTSAKVRECESAKVGASARSSAFAWLRTLGCVGRRMQPGLRVRAGGLCEVAAANSFAPAGMRTGHRSRAGYSLFPVPYSLALLAACSDSHAKPTVIDNQPTAAAHLAVAAPARSRTALRVCADPNNLPFSNQAGEGFENRIARLIGDELGLPVQYTWHAQRRGFIRETLRAGECDLVMGVPTSLELVLPTRPYYRSTYVFVYRKDAGFDVRSFDDPVLKTKRIGVHLVGDDGANTPPAHALAARGIIGGNVRGYMLYGDYARPNPPADILAALARGEIDVAIVWGPLAGYFAPRQDVPLKIVPVSPQIDVPFLPFVYDISMGVRRGDAGLKADVEGVMMRRRADIDAILTEYGVPRVSNRRSPAPEESSR